MKQLLSSLSNPPKTSSSIQFSRLTHTLVVLTSILTFALAATILGLYACLTAYHFSWTTRHANATITNWENYNGQSIAYIPSHVSMYSYYTSLALAPLALLVSFGLTYFSIQNEFHSRFLHRTFPRLPLLVLFSALLFLSVLAGTIVGWISWHNSFKIILPPLPTDNHTRRTVGYTYTPDAYSCSLSHWLSGWEYARTSQVCLIGQAARWSWIVLLGCSCLILMCVVFSIYAAHRSRTTIADKRTAHMSVPAHHTSLDSRNPTIVDPAGDDDAMAEMESSVRPTLFSAPMLGGGTVNSVEPPPYNADLAELPGDTKILVEQGADEKRSLRMLDA